MDTARIREFVDEWIQQEEKDKVEDLLNDSWESWTEEFQQKVKQILFNLVASWEEKKNIESMAEAIKA